MDPGKNGRDHADGSLPAGRRPIDGHMDGQIVSLTPGRNLVGERQLFRSAGSDDDLDDAESIALREDLGDHRPKWRQADTPGHDHQIAPSRCVQPPARAVRTTHTKRLADLKPAECPGDAPTFLIVCLMGASTTGFPLMEIATSPTAYA